MQQMDQRDRHRLWQAAVARRGLGNGRDAPMNETRSQEGSWRRGRRNFGEVMRSSA